MQRERILWVEDSGISKSRYMILAMVLFRREPRKVSGAHGKAVHYSRLISYVWSDDGGGRRLVYSLARSLSSTVMVFATLTPEVCSFSYFAVLTTTDGCRLYSLSLSFWGGFSFFASVKEEK
jgi:hypothetical protein